MQILKEKQTFGSIANSKITVAKKLIFIDKKRSMKEKSFKIIKNKLILALKFLSFEIWDKSSAVRFLGGLSLSRNFATFKVNK